MYLWSEKGDKLDSWQPHARPVAAVKQNGRGLVISVGDIVCIYDAEERSWFMSAWNDSALTDVEWLKDGKTYLVGDYNGSIIMDRVSDTQFMPVS